MNIVLITQITPTEDNFNGPSALMYHLLLHRASDISVCIFTTNSNQVTDQEIDSIARKMNAKIEVFSTKKKSRLFAKQKVAHIFAKLKGEIEIPVRYTEKLPVWVLDKIQSIKPDLIWLYPHNCLGFIQQLDGYKMVVTGPDCASLHLSRALRDSFLFRNNTHVSLSWNELILNYERELAKKQVLIHLVGQTDVDYFRCLSGNDNAVFFPHPHYNLANKVIDLQNRSKIKVVLSGKPDIYTNTDVNEFLRLLLTSTVKLLKDRFEYTFLGKMWTPYVDKLVGAGYEVKQIGWVDNYIESLAEYDVQIFPISVGSGTKGKVLDALSTGLVSIGSDYAFENIAVEDGESCCVYKRCSEILDFLKKIAECPSEYEKMADLGRKQVRLYHNPEMIISNIIKYLESGECNIDNRVYYYLSLK
ncbi:MAG: glycosyltransferase [Bacteroides sp.]|nr:glycosyltransferase [Bacteroides sp.]